MLVNKLFTKVLRRFETCLSVRNNLCEKLVSSLESPKKAAFFSADFDLFISELDSFTFTLFY